MKLKKQPEYPFVKYNKWISDQEQQSNKKVLNLGIGTPDFPPSKLYINKLKEFLDDKNTHLYPGYKAIKEFSKAIRNWYKKRFNVELLLDEFLPLNGAKDGISHLPYIFTDIGDEILIPNPGYPGFSSNIELIGRKPIFYDLSEKNNFKIDVKELDKKISNKTKFIWINFPSNPTGQTASHKDLEKIINFAKQKNIWLVYDNAYSEITFNGYKAPSILEIPKAKDITIEIGSFSKTFSFAGYRMGWAVGNHKIISELMKVKSQFDSGMSIPLQQLGAFALDNFDNSWYQQMLDNYKNRAKILREKLISLGLESNNPNGGLYLWSKVPNNYNNSEEFSFDVLKRKNIFLTPGTTFGKNGKRYVRISFCSNIDNINNYF